MSCNTKMKFKVAVVLLTIVGCIIADEQNVLHLTDDDFLTQLADTNTNLVMFYFNE